MMKLFRRNRSSKADADAADAGSYSDLVDARVMDQIGHLELISRRVVDGLLAGKHRSTTKGGCCEFAEHRQYAPGDEIRQIDWRVYARNDRYFIRQFEEETNLHAILAVDTSGSMKFGVQTVSKLDYAKRAAACLGRLLLHQRDSVGMAILNETKPLFVPPRQSAIHLQTLLAALGQAEASDGCELGVQVRGVVPRLRRRGLFVLFSDCFGDLDELGKALRVVRARGHDVVVIHLMAPEEVRFDFRHWSTFQSLEANEKKLNLDPAAIRDVYLERVRRFLDDLEVLVVGLGGDYLRATTNQDLADVLGQFLRQRMAKTT
jgi:uncharacterized protein (DUF58 family)